MRRREMGLALLASGVPAWAGAAVGAARPVLRFIVGESWTSPYIELGPNGPVGGLMFELAQAIAGEMGAQAEFVSLPSLRVDAALDTGAADLHCLISPQWFGGHPPAAERFGPPMIVLEDVLAAPAGTAPIDLEAQRGLRVGTVLGYRYGALEPLFADGRLVREEAPSQRRMLEKLARGRSAVAIVDRLALAAFNRGLPEARRLVALRSLSQTPTQCLFGNRPDLPTQPLHAALERLVKRGDVRRLVARYR